MSRAGPSTWRISAAMCHVAASTWHERHPPTSRRRESQVTSSGHEMQSTHPAESEEATEETKRGDEEATGEMKRYKESAEKVKEEFSCPITRELLFDPVTAEDGHLYERSAIESWISCCSEELKSPKTNVPMGPRLMSSTVVRSAIEQMVRDGVVICPEWTQRLADEKTVRAVREKAEGGNTDAMNSLGAWYHGGQKGLPKDQKQAFAWYQRGHRLGGSPKLTRNLAGCYLFGHGVESDEALGMHLLTLAAERGSEFARYTLAQCFALGTAGLSKNVHEANHWFRAMESASVLIPDAMQEECRDEAAAWLRDHAAEIEAEL